MLRENPLMQKFKNNCLSEGTVLHGKSYTYQVRKVLGQGSFGITYLASVSMHGDLGSIGCDVCVAIKEFFMSDINGRDNTRVTADSGEGLVAYYRSKFAHEAERLGKLHHPNIVKVLECFEENDTMYYVMEYVEGCSLDAYIAQRGCMLEAEALPVTRQIGNALSFLHSKKILHLDLKPANVMRRDDGTMVLIDFGLSKQYDGNGEPESSTTVGNGTPGYAPLEQEGCYKGDNHFPVTMDVYALGATLYKMLIGHSPDRAYVILNDGFPGDMLRKCGVSDSVVSLLAKAMAPLVSDRYQSVPEFLRELDSMCADTDTDDVEVTGVCEAPLDCRGDESWHRGIRNCRLVRGVGRKEWLCCGAAALLFAILGYFSVTMFRSVAYSGADDFTAIKGDALHAISDGTDSSDADMQTAADTVIHASVENMKKELNDYLKLADANCDKAERQPGNESMIQMILDAKYYYYDKANGIYTRLYGKSMAPNKRIGDLVAREYNYWIEKGNDAGKDRKNYEQKRKCYKNAYRLVRSDRMKAYIEWLDEQIKH